MTPATTCTTNTNEVILSNDKLIYCNGINQIQFSETEQYVQLTGIDVSSSLYPIITKGDDNILLKIDFNSVTQYEGSDGKKIFLNYKILLYR